MKKILGLTLVLASIGFVGTTSEAKASGVSASTVTVNANPSPQWSRDRGRGDRNRGWGRRSRVVTRSRVVRYGRRVYRETYQVRYFANGRTDTRLISRVRIS